MQGRRFDGIKFLLSVRLWRDGRTDGQQSRLTLYRANARDAVQTNIARLILTNDEAV